MRASLLESTGNDACQFEMGGSNVLFWSPQFFKNS